MQQRVIAGPQGGITVSALALGTMYFGTYTEEKVAFDLLDRFHAAGGTFLDSADCYNQWLGKGGESEEVIGRWVRSRGVRDEVVLATKLGAQTTDPEKPWPDFFEGLRGDTIRAAFEKSLRRFDVDHVDLLYAHWDDRSAPLEERVDALAEIAESGRARALGASNIAAWRLEQARSLARAAGRPGFTAVQQKYTYLWTRQLPRQTDQASDELLDYAAENDITVMAYTPLLKGAYQRSDVELPLTYDHPSNAVRLAELKAVAAELGATPNQVVLAWLMGGEVPVIPIIGASNVAQLEESLGAVELTLDDETRARLDAAGQGIDAGQRVSV
ncbi:aldo/keto reductase [Luedemannella flava]|uniref:Aldo/keto reductase n=1 Tax=Luedemannella flava TaxID=349316 RepID=A0ABP4Y2B2_9ACTN